MLQQKQSPGRRGAPTYLQVSTWQVKAWEYVGAPLRSGGYSYSNNPLVRGRYYTALYCTVLNCNIMHYTALYCTALHCTININIIITFIFLNQCFFCSLSVQKSCNIFTRPSIAGAVLQNNFVIDSFAD